MVAPPSTTPLALNTPTVEGTIASFLAAKGLTVPQIAGVMGNMQVESSFDPSALNRKEGAIGLAQWEGQRRTALDAYAAKQGTSETDLNTQLGYLWAELSGPEQASLTALQQTTTPAQAAAVWDQDFERSAGTSRTQRENDAVKIAAQLAPYGSSDGSITATDASFLSGAGSVVGGVLTGNLGSVASGLGQEATGAVGDLVSGAASGVWSAAAPDVYKIAFGLVAGGLVIGGLYQAFKPAVHSAAGKVQSAAGNAVKLGALA